jgi:hypothetical protein
VTILKEIEENLVEAIRIYRHNARSLRNLLDGSAVEDREKLKFLFDRVPSSLASCRFALERFLRDATKEELVNLLTSAPEPHLFKLLLLTLRPPIGEQT